ncbi:MAG: hypothetical protein M3380_21960, partial [Chloroflexota bacterium]|nr:hypothetical protein [Chloroflexota bacterium]
SKVLPDPRDVGIRLDDVILRWPAGAWAFPQWPTLIVQWATVVVALVVAWRFELPRRGLVVVTAGLVLLLGWMAAHDLFVAYVWSNRVLVASLAMLALFWRPFPLLSRVLPGLGRAELRLIGLVIAAAIAIRLLGVFYPHFGSHDLIIHRWRLREVQLGYLYLFDKPSEFGQQTVVPPAFYLLVMPFTLLIDNSAFTLQAAYALLDGSYALLVAILVRQIGGSGRAATLAAITTATLPIQFTALWWGFGPQIAGQWLLVLLALLVERRNSTSRYAWFVAGVVLALALLTHNSALFLGGVWLAGYVLLASRFQPQSLWKRWGVILLASSLVATLLLYADSVGLYLGGFARGATETSVDESLRVVLIGKGLRSSVRPLGLMLCVLSVVMVLRRAPTTYHLLVVAWLLSAGLFLAVDLLFGLQVRYAYFAIPVICAGFGLLLDGLMRRGRWGWLIGWSAIAITSLAGLSLWYAGVIWNIKPTLTALTH